MLALSPPLFSTNIGYWPLEEAIGHEDQINYFYRDIEVSNNYSSAQDSEFLDRFPAPPPSDCNNYQRPQGAEIDCAATQSATATPISSSGLSMAVKKLNHNASERDRRKKINQMYTSLRTLLPPSDHTKKLSIPATVSRVLKYIPELQQQVEGLIRKREELLSRINSKRQGNNNNLQVNREINGNNRTKSSSPTTTLSSISASQLNDKEVSVQISTHKVDKKPLSKTLHNLEKDGLSVLSASSFESSGNRLFHNLHLQVDGSSCGVEYGTLGDKLKSLSSDDNDEFFIL